MLTRKRVIWSVVIIVVVCIGTALMIKRSAMSHEADVIVADIEAYVEEFNDSPRSFEDLARVSQAGLSADERSALFWLSCDNEGAVVDCMVMSRSLPPVSRSVWLPLREVSEKATD